MSFFWYIVAAAACAAVINAIVMAILDAILVKRGVLPRREATTVEDVKRLRDQGRRYWALRRLRQLPEFSRLSLKQGKKKLAEL